MPERDYVTPTPAELLEIIEKFEGLAVAASRDGWVESPVATQNLANGIVYLAMNLRPRILREMERGEADAIPPEMIGGDWREALVPPPPAPDRAAAVEAFEEVREGARGIDAICRKIEARSRGPFGLWPFARRRTT